MSQSPKEFAQLLTQALNRIKKRTSDPIYKIEDELGEAIHHTRETIEKWRRGRLPADLEQVETIAKILLDKGGLVDREEFEEFLSYAGQSRPAPIWKEVHLSRVDGPAPNEFFVGREDKVKELLTAVLDQETKVISLRGSGGVGKTALITTLIDQLAPDKKPPKQFPDGILYYNFYGHYSFNDAYQYIIDFFGEKISQNINLRDATRNVLRNKQALLVLDGAEEADDLGKLLEIRDLNKLLIATRYWHTTRGRTVIDLNPPLPDEAVSILKAWSTMAQNALDFQIWNNAQGADQPIAIEICKLVGCLPLALRLAGRYMVQCKKNLSEYLELLKQTPLLVLHEKERQHESVPVLLKHSIQALPEEARSVLAAIGLLSHEPFQIALLEEALAESTHPIRRLIGELVRFGMVIRLPDNRYQVAHRLIQIYCREHLPAQDRILDNLVRTYSWIYHEIIKPNPEEYTLDTEKEHITALLNRCVERELWEMVLFLVFLMYNCFPPRRYYHEETLITIAILEIGVKAAQITSKRSTEADFLQHLGDMHNGQYTGHSGKEQQALHYYDQALMIYRELGKNLGEFDCLRKIMSQYYRIEQWKEVIKYSELILQMNREIGDLDIECSALRCLGDAYSKLNQKEQAIDYYYQAAINSYKLTLEHGDDTFYPNKFGTSMARLAGALKELHHPKKAIRYYKQCIKSARETAPREVEIALLHKLIDYLSSLGLSVRPEKELITAYERIIELDPNDIYPYHCLAITYAISDQLYKASWYYKRYMELNPDGSIDAYVYFGLVTHYKGKEDEARKYFETALAKFEGYSRLPKEYQLLTKNLLAECEVYALLGVGQEKKALLKLENALISYSSDSPKKKLFPLFCKLLITAPNPLPALDRIKWLLEMYDQNPFDGLLGATTFDINPN